MIFLTVGTQFPFDRLVRAVDKAMDNNLIEEEVFAQIGRSAYQPHNFESVSFLDKQAFDEKMQNASGIISHAGMGIITLALDNNKPLLVMPRLKEYNEVVNNHQTAVARKFAQLGHLLAAYKSEDLIGNIKKLKSFMPVKRHRDVSVVIAQISKFLDDLNNICNREK
jgi:UDP-N-acetylglucosamine transferase subunit ALG13